MIKSGAYDVAKSKKKVAESNKKSFLEIHLGKILNFLRLRVQQIPIGKVAVSFGAVILALIIIETSLRIIEDEKYDFSACQSLDRDFHHVMVPGSVCRFKTDEWDVTYKINRFGLRDEEINLEKGQKNRILLLGDSFVQGHGVEAEESFGEVLETKLFGEELGYEVISAGVFGYSPMVEYLYLRKEGLKFKPDLVVLALTLTDFWEDRQRFSELRLSYPGKNDGQIQELIPRGEAVFDWGKINRGGTLAPELSALDETLFKIKQFLKKNFRIYRLLADFWDKQDRVKVQDIEYQGDIDRDIIALVRGEKISDSNWEKLWQLPLAHILFAKNFLDDMGIPLLVVAIPDAFAVSEKEWPGRSGLAIPSQFRDPRGDWQMELSKRLADLGIPFINLLDDFRKSDNFPLYFSLDGHFRQSGHSLAALVIFRELANLGYLH